MYLTQKYQFWSDGGFDTVPQSRLNTNFKTWDRV